MTIDTHRARREMLRWYVILTLNTSRPTVTSELLILTTIQGIIPDATPQEIRCELEYLAGKDFVTVTRQPHGHWLGVLTSHGIDLAEYTIDCPAGIARPVKYW